MNEKISVAIIGCGGRGKDTYARISKLISEKMKIVAAADIVREKVDEMAFLYNIAPENCFNSAEEFLEHDKMADAVFICTQDRQHVAHAVPALKKGYHVLLEKPVSPVLEECEELVKVAHETKKEVVVCHVLRYTPFYQKLKEVVDSGAIGEIVSIQAIENVGYWHQAHSFVRGNWRKASETSPMILQKCCHDMDIFVWLTGKKCKAISSFGDTFLFKSEKAPAGAAKRCMDGCKIKDECVFDAEKIYITNEATGVAHGRKGWPNDILTLHPTVESITRAIKEGQYGRCVYHCDNDVVDHQVVNALMEGGCTIELTMSGFTTKQHRYTKIMGTLGEIEGDMKANTIEISKFGGKVETIDISKLSTDFSGHAGGDRRLVENFLNVIVGKEKALSSIDVSLESHHMALAAEKSRLNGGQTIKL